MTVTATISVTPDPAPSPNTAPALDLSASTALITFLLDRSGSMEIIKASTIEAFNAYLDGLAELRTNAAVTLVQFDSYALDKTFIDQSPQEAPRLSATNFVPRGGTPLIDAAYETIEATARKLSGKPRDTKVIICIQTDGQENSSTKHSWATLNSLIKAKIAEGWQFNFMGASIDAYAQGAKMGLSAGQTMSYNSADLGQTRSAYQSRATATQNYLSGDAATMDFMPADKAAAGDIYDPDRRVPPLNGGIAIGNGTIVPPKPSGVADALTRLDLTQGAPTPPATPAKTPQVPRQSAVEPFEL